MQTFGAQLRRDERGATMVEYGLMVALIAILLITAILVLSGALGDLFEDAGSAVENRGEPG
jgi:pilus assembly protein Flp/PilA